MPDITENYVGQGIHALEGGDYTSAIEVFTKALRLSLGDLAEIHYQRGLAYWGLNDEEQALADWDETLRRNPYHSAAYYERAQIWEQRGNDENASHARKRPTTQRGAATHGTSPR